MTDDTKDTGTILAILDRCKNQKLPRVLALKDKVDRGEKLNDYDIRFLDESFKDASQVSHLLDLHPEFSALAAHIFHLLKEISEKSLENEKTK